MKISLVGAQERVSKSLMSMIMVSRVLGAEDMVQLVEEKEERSFYALEGLRSDLLDAVGMGTEQLELCFQPEDVDGDVVVMVGALSYYPLFDKSPRDAVSLYHLDMARKYAEAIASKGRDPLFLVMMEPVEAVVELLTRYFPRGKVVGVGAFLDALRFRKEIATALGIPRSHVEALVIGEHGACMIPLWSSVKILGMTKEELRSNINRLRKGRSYEASCILEPWEYAVKIIKKESPMKVFKIFAELPLCVKVFVRPWLACQMGMEAVFGPAGAALRIIGVLLRGEYFFGPLQMRLKGEFHGVDTVFGVPVVLGAGGVVHIVDVHLWEVERAMIPAANQGIKERIREILPE
jgi:malate dehydrogenase